MRSMDENKAALLELGSFPVMWRMLETMPHPSEEFGLWLIHSSTMMGRRVSWREISEQAVAP